MLTLESGGLDKSVKIQEIYTHNIVKKLTTNCFTLAEMQKQASAEMQKIERDPGLVFQSFQLHSLLPARGRRLRPPNLINDRRRRHSHRWRRSWSYSLHLGIEILAIQWPHVQ